MLKTISLEGILNKVTDYFTPLINNKDHCHSQCKNNEEEIFTLPRSTKRTNNATKKKPRKTLFLKVSRVLAEGLISKFYLEAYGSANVLSLF